MNLTEAVDLFSGDLYNRRTLFLASGDRKERIAKLLSVPFDPQVHYPIAYIHLYYAMLDEAANILDYAPDKTDETYQQLNDYLQAMQECERSHIGIFPLNISYRKWWDGPHLPFPETYKEKKLAVWYPIRVDCIENNIVHCSLGEKVDNKIHYFYIECPLDKFQIPPKEDQMGEMAVYGDDGDDDSLILLHLQEKWEQKPELKAVADQVGEIIKKSHDALFEALEDDFQNTSQINPPKPRP